MAWISVHEQVLSGKLRSLAKEMGCSQNEALGLLVRLWLWGINNADSTGKIIGAEKADVAEVLTVGIGSSISPDRAVDALIATNWIDFDGDLYLHDWDEWQQQWYKAIAIREKDAERKRLDRAKKNSTEAAMNDVAPEPKPDKPAGESKGKSGNSGKKKDEYPEDFCEFWDAYPRKVGKGDAFKKWKTRIKTWKPEQLIKAAKSYASKISREKTDMMYVKHPATFLSDTEPFKDYIPLEEPPAPVTDDNSNPYEGWKE